MAELILPATVVFHLETVAKLLKLLERVLADFSKCALKLLDNQADFDSAIPRFESWRPSQPVRSLRCDFQVWENRRHSRPKIAEVLRGCATASGLGVALAGGKVNETPLSANVWLAYQRRFSLKPSPDGARTLLLEVIPDLTISRVAGNGRCVSLVVLDPKYRAHQSLLDGLRDMHVYRDAIIDSDGIRLVKAAAALAPRPARLPEATAGLPPDRPAVLALRPGQHQTTFQRLLDLSLRALDG
jgi:hypothetical protein